MTRRSCGVIAYSPFGVVGPGAEAGAVLLVWVIDLCQVLGKPHPRQFPRLPNHRL